MRLALVLIATMLTACTAAPGSTRLTHGDFDAAVAALSQSLASSEFLAARTPQSPPIRIVTNRVMNLSSDVITPAEQWMLVARLQSSLPIREMADQRNIVFQIPPEEIRRLQDRGFEVGLAPEDRPTHLLTATIRSATRAADLAASGFADLRKEYYRIEFEIVDLALRTPVWTDQFELAREAVGLTID